MKAEIIYCLLESSIIVLFLFRYFRQKEVLSKFFRTGIVYSCFAIFDIAITVLSQPCQVTIPMTIIILTILLRVFFDGRLGEHILIPIIISSLIILTDVCTITLLGKLLGYSYQEMLAASGIRRFLTVLIAKVVYSIVLGLIVIVKKHSYSNFSVYEFAMLSGTFLTSIALVIILRTMIYKTGSDATPFLLVLGCVLLLNIGHFCLILFINKQNINHQKMNLMEKQLEMQAKDIKAIEKQYEETAKIRHDMKNYLSCALNLAEQEQNHQLVCYLSSLISEKIDSISTFVHIDNPAIGAVINSKLTIAEKNGIKIHCIVLCEFDSLSELDICILLSNILDNAIEACSKNREESEIKLKIWIEAGYYCIDLGNSVENDILCANPHMLTTKKNKMMHGYGLKSVRDIVEKYNGILSFKQIENMFHVYISLIRDA